MTGTVCDLLHGGRGTDQHPTCSRKQHASLSCILTLTRPASRQGALVGVRSSILWG